MLAFAADGGYYQSMAQFLEQMFGKVLKPGLGERNSLHKALLVGAHRFSGESFNNCCIDGLLRGWPALTPAFGFTEEETAEVLRAAGLSERLEDVRRWYGGYRSGKRDLYWPADVMRLASEVQAGKVAADFALPNYAAHDVLPSAVIRKIPMLGWMDRDAVIALADNRPAWVHLDDSVYGNDLATKYGANLWTLLVQTGLLSVTAERPGRVWRYDYEVRFSNLSTKAVLDKAMVKPFIDDIPEDILAELCGS